MSAAVVDIHTGAEVVNPTIFDQNQTLNEVRLLASELLYAMIAARQRARDELAERVRTIYERGRERGMSLFEERRAMQLARDDASLLSIAGVYI
jgi:histidine ammonia-lyase